MSCDPDAIRREVESRLSPERFRHTLGVVESAMELCDRFGGDKEKALVAALLHDVAKEYSKDRLLNEALQFGIILSDIERRQAVLIHAPLGAAIAEREFGVTDKDTLAAIRYHTTGRRGMSLLERIVFLADCIEPGRSFPGVEELRQKARTSLDEAVLLALDRTIAHLLERGLLIHPDAVAARNELIMARG